MKTINVKVYQFNELSDHARQVAMDNYMEHYMGYWYDYVVEDMKPIDLYLEEFDIYRNYCKIRFQQEAEDTAQAIIEEGYAGTLKEIVEEWQEDVNNALKSYSKYDEYIDWINDRGFTEDDFDFDDWLLYESGYAEDKESMDLDFLKQLSDYYLQRLHDDYTYYTSESYIEDFYDRNNALFLESGEEALNEE